MHCKVIGSRGRKRALWVQAVYKDLFDKFHFLRRAGCKITASTLKCVALDLLREGSDNVYGFGLEGPKSKKGMEKIVNYAWISRFLDAHGLHSRCQSGKLQLSPEKTKKMERDVARYMGMLKRDFEAGVLDENCVENGDETHFVVNMDNGRTVGAIGDSEIRYADVVSGGIGITMYVRVSGGARAQLQPSFLVFQSDGTYPIRGLEDNIPGVSYRVGKKGWMDRKVMAEYFGEHRAIRPLAQGAQRILFMDNCGGHGETSDSVAALSRIRTTVRFLPPNSTHLTQPCDSFLIQKIKAEWRRRWDEEKLKMIEKGMWKDGPNSSGKLINPGKKHFLQLAADCVKSVNSMKDGSGLSWSRNAMIRCGLSLGLNGEWSREQLSPELQEIIL
jgi:DDE superfamily endonuclease